jgi:hypothetical protein
MAARKTTPAKTATAKAEPKKRAPKPVTDLATATTALKAAQRRYDRAYRAYADAKREELAANDALTEAKETVKKFYAELMGEGQSADEGTDVSQHGEDLTAAYSEQEPAYEGDGHGDTAHDA